jgi:hypothetical protein
MVITALQKIQRCYALNGKAASSLGQLENSGLTCNLTIYKMPAIKSGFYPCAAALIKDVVYPYSVLWSGCAA